MIRGGTVVDGSGRPAVLADVAIKDGVIAEEVQVGPRRELDAAALVTPGWVDVHTHYDGQVTWDPAHALIVVWRHDRRGPASPARRSPTSRLADRSDGGGRGYPRRRSLRASTGHGRPSLSTWMRSKERRAIDFVQPPHGAIRAYVMASAAQNEEATAEDVAAMAQVVEECSSRRPCSTEDADASLDRRGPSAGNLRRSPRAGIGEALKKTGVVSSACGAA